MSWSAVATAASWPSAQPTTGGTFLVLGAGGLTFRGDFEHGIVYVQGAWSYAVSAGHLGRLTDPRFFPTSAQQVAYTQTTPSATGSMQLLTVNTDGTLSGGNGGAGTAFYASGLYFLDT